MHLVVGDAVGGVEARGEVRGVVQQADRQGCETAEAVEVCGGVQAGRFEPGGREAPLYGAGEEGERYRLEVAGSGGAGPEGVGVIVCS